MKICQYCMNNRVCKEYDSVHGKIFVCKRCFEYYRHCDFCNILAVADNIFPVFDDLKKNYYCETCYRKAAFTCSGCGASYLNIHKHPSGYCEYCIKKNRIRKCIDCLQYCHGFKNCIVCNKPEIRCGVCLSRHMDKHKKIFVPDINGFFSGQNSGKIITINKLVGLELEMELGKLDVLKCTCPKVLRFDHDGSLMPLPNGVELVTVPASMDKLEEYVIAICESAVNARWKPTKKCGMHVNIDARRYNHSYVVKLFKADYAVEDILFSMLPANRWANKYCVRLSSLYGPGIFSSSSNKELEEQWYTIGKDSPYGPEERKGHKYDHSRYAGFNLHAYFWRQRFEFRHHSGTLNPEKILNWTQILLKMVDYCENRWNNMEIKRLHYMETNESKLMKFFEIFRLSDDLQTYIKSRIDKFNPGFAIKFADPQGYDVSSRRREVSEFLEIKKSDLNYIMRNGDRNQVKFAKLEVEQLETVLNSDFNLRFLPASLIAERIPGVIPLLPEGIDLEMSEML